MLDSWLAGASQLWVVSCWMSNERSSEPWQLLHKRATNSPREMRTQTSWWQVWSSPTPLHPSIICRICCNKNPIAIIFWLILQLWLQLQRAFLFLFFVGLKSLTLTIETQVLSLSLARKKNSKKKRKVMNPTEMHLLFNAFKLLTSTGTSGHCTIRPSQFIITL